MRGSGEMRLLDVAGGTDEPSLKLPFVHHSIGHAILCISVSLLRMAGIKAGVVSMRGSGEMRLLDVAGGTGEPSLELLHV
jgi:hypothetical protein